MTNKWRRYLPWGRGQKDALPRPSPQPAGTSIVFGGRRFTRLTESTVEHDFRLIALLHDIGLDQPMTMDGESPAEYGQRLLRDLITSNRALEVLGHLLVPEGMSPQEWSVATSKETAAYLGSLVHPDDKQRIYALTLEFLLSFFQAELDSLMISPASSETTASRAGKNGKRKREIRRVVRLGTGPT